MLPDKFTVPAALLMVTVLVPRVNIPLLVQLPATFIGLAPAHANVAPRSLVKLPARVVVVTDGLIATVTVPPELLF
jgi:hypothetical protein